MKLNFKRDTAAPAWKPTVSSAPADDDLLDDDLLLEESDRAAVTAECAPDAGGKKRACKNCSCGLAEEEAKEQLDQVTKARNTADVKSACGSVRNTFFCSILALTLSPSATSAIRSAARRAPAAASRRSSPASRSSSAWETTLIFDHSI